MAEIVDTAQLKKDELNYSHGQAVYNGFDCTLTREIHDKLIPQVEENPNAALIYKFERALRAPALEMMVRGLKVDLNERSRMINDCEEKIENLRRLLNGTIFELLGWKEDQKGWRLNPASPQKLQYFFYGVCRLPEHIKWDKGERKATVNREALEKFQEQCNFPIDYICTIMLALRDLGKTVGTLRWGVEKDGRMRFAYHPAKTETGRFSSSANVFGRGGNAQNITQRIRRIFVADKGRKLGYCDLQSAESMAVAFMAGDDNYIRANTAEMKVHTLVAQMVWPEVDWPNDPDRATEKAQEDFYRGFSRYDLAKRGAHGSNYAGTPQTMAKHLKVDTSLMEDFQERYFSTFNQIREWHKWTSAQIQKNGTLTTPLGRRRRFFGRRNDKATLREAIAFAPQSFVGDILNLAMYLVWRDFYPQVRLMSQLHDAILIDYPEELEDQILPQILETMKIPVKIEGCDGVEREIVIPADAKVGWNWAEVKKKDLDKNPDGLIEWKGNDQRKRQIPAEIPLEERIL